MPSVPLMAFDSLNSHLLHAFEAKLCPAKCSPAPEQLPLQIFRGHLSLSFGRKKSWIFNLPIPQKYSWQRPSTATSPRYIDLKTSIRSYSGTPKHLGNAWDPHLSCAWCSSDGIGLMLLCKRTSGSLFETALSPEHRDEVTLSRFHHTLQQTMTIICSNK